MSNDDFQVVYDILSFSLACMMSCTLFLWMRAPSVTERYKTPVLISGLVTFIAAYHYPAAKNGIIQAPEISGVPFNDAYRYMDWLLTVPLLLMEIVLTMSVPEAEANSKCWSLGVFSALMIVSGYRGELVIQGDLSTRWTHWFVSMLFFSYVV